MESYFERSYASLDELFRFLDRGLNASEISDSDAFAVRLALEELFTNIVKYSTAKSNGITVRLDIIDDELVIVVTDSDAEPFDPTTYPSPNLHAPLSERRPGGLGLYLVQNMVDSIEHEYADRKNIITLKKKVGT